jgi:hypothetical protein
MKRSQLRRSTRNSSTMTPREARLLQRNRRLSPRRPQKRQASKKKKKAKAAPAPDQQQDAEEELPQSPRQQQPPRRNIYCGNNRRHPNAENLGTRYECLRKGIGAGCYVIPVDLELNDYEYEAIDGVRLYCGRNVILPAGYTRLGNSAECFQIGRGIGMKKRAGGRCRGG